MADTCQLITTGHTLWVSGNGLACTSEKLLVSSDSVVIRLYTPEVLVRKVQSDMIDGLKEAG